MLTPASVAGELAYLDRPMTGGFERPYGWAWLLALQAEAARHDASRGEALAPLAAVFATRLADYLPKLTYPIRVGTHFNTAFALVLTRDWAVERDHGLAAPTEALLMSRVLPAAAFAAWFDLFLPDLVRDEPATLFDPAIVSDRSDGKVAHPGGLNLNRAWCWRSIALVLGPDHPARGAMIEAADRHLAASMPHLDDGYMGSHWLTTFALLATMDSRSD